MCSIARPVKFKIQRVSWKANVNMYNQNVGTIATIKRRFDCYIKEEKYFFFIKSNHPHINMEYTYTFVNWFWSFTPPELKVSFSNHSLSGVCLSDRLYNFLHFHHLHQNHETNFNLPQNIFRWRTTPFFKGR